MKCLNFIRGHLLRLQRGERNFLPLKIFKTNPSAITVSSTVCVLLSIHFYQTTTLFHVKDA